MVLRKVSKNLPLLSSSKPVFCPVLSLPASSSALASPQDCHWSRTGELRQQGWGQAKEGVTLGARGQAGCLGIYTMLVVLYHLINFLKNGKKWGEKSLLANNIKCVGWLTLFFVNWLLWFSSPHGSSIMGNAVSAISVISCFQGLWRSFQKQPPQFPHDPS